MVGGRFVVRERRLLTVDLPALAARAATLRAEIDARSVASRRRFDAVAPIIGDFCPALAGGWHITGVGSMRAGIRVTVNEMSNMGSEAKPIKFGYPRIPITTGRLVMSIRASIHSTNFAVG